MRVETEDTPTARAHYLRNLIEHERNHLGPIRMMLEIFPDEHDMVKVVKLGEIAACEARIKVYEEWLAKYQH